MRPPIVSESAILSVIEELERGGGARVSGSAIRDRLASRFGARGGVERIYRLLRKHRAPGTAAAGSPRPPGNGVPATGESREAAIARADLAERRERVHQERWARETDELRTRLAAAEQAARDAELARQRVGDLSRALASAQVRIASLEQTRLDGAGPSDR